MEEDSILEVQESKQSRWNNQLEAIKNALKSTLNYDFFASHYSNEEEQIQEDPRNEEENQSISSPFPSSLSDTLNLKDRLALNPKNPQENFGNSPKNSKISSIHRKNDWKDRSFDEELDHDEEDERDGDVSLEILNESRESLDSFTEDALNPVVEGEEPEDAYQLSQSEQNLRTDKEEEEEEIKECVRYNPPEKVESIPVVKISPPFEDETLSKNQVKVNKIVVEWIDGKEKVTHLKETQMCCRAFRAVGNDMNRFLVVHFGQIKSNWKRKGIVKKYMEEGASFQGKTYKFLGFSDNDISANRQVYFLEEEDYNCQSLLEHLGDLKEVWRKEGVKYFARFGMCFSSSISVMKITKDQVCVIPDREVPKDKQMDEVQLHLSKFMGKKLPTWNFTDGCGFLTTQAAEAVSKYLKLKKIPSVFQFRWGGAKGVLVVHPSYVIKSILKDLGVEYNEKHLMYLRDSNIKFESNYEELEILDYSKEVFTPAALNFGTILILDDLKVPFENFIQLMDNQLENIKMMTKDHKVLAKFLPSYSKDVDGTFLNKIWEMNLGRAPLDEPHLAHMIRRLQTSELKCLKEKMRLQVPGSRYLFGIADDTQTLKPGEVYVTFGDSPLIGDVVVFRHPCYHPGDIQKLKAVAPSELMHLTQPCIVFPTTGDRPIPDTMGGGDLDGDRFFVSNCSLIIPPQNEPPADYSAAKTPSPYRNLTFGEASYRFFTEFPERNITGLVANTWMIATQLYGSKSDEARNLATSFGRAIDSAKSGVIEPWDPKNDRYRNLPTIVFGVKYRDDPKYRMTRKFNPLQALIRRIDNVLLDNNQISRRLIPFECFAYKRDSEQWQQFYKDAASEIKTFNKRLCDSIECDYREKAKKPKKEQKFKLISFPEKKPILHSEQLGIEYRRIHFDCLEDEDRKTKASAWYFCAYEQKKEAFGWIGYNYLNHILADNSWKERFGRPAPRIALEPLNASV